MGASMVAGWAELLQYLPIDSLTFFTHLSRFALRGHDRTCFGRLLMISHQDLRQAFGGMPFECMDGSILPQDHIEDVQVAWHGLCFTMESMTTTINLCVVIFIFLILQLISLITNRTAPLQDLLFPNGLLSCIFLLILLVWAFMQDLYLHVYLKKYDIHMEHLYSFILGDRTVGQMARGGLGLACSMWNIFLIMVVSWRAKVE